MTEFAIIQFGSPAEADPWQAERCGLLACLTYFL
jgi:hypothetical protein